jgi:hypothetical protein
MSKKAADDLNPNKNGFNDTFDPNKNGAKDWFNNVPSTIGEYSNPASFINLTVLYIILIIISGLIVLYAVFLTATTPMQYYYVGDFFIHLFSLIQWTITSPFVNLFEIITSQMDKMSREPDYRSCIIKYGGLFGFIAMIATILYYASTDSSVLMSKSYIYALAIILPLVALLAFVVPFSGSGALTQMCIVGTVIALIGSVVYFYSRANSPTIIFLGYILNAILFLGTIAALAIFFYLFSNYLKSSDGIVGVLIYLIFYIPCLFIDFTKFIINEFRMTTNVVYVLFILEIVLVLLYIYLPQFISYAFKVDGASLLPGSKFLDREHIISNSEPFAITDVEKKKLGINPNGNATTTYRREYSISMWVYLNSQPANYASYAKEVPVFCYGPSNNSTNGTGKPKITYFNNNSDPDKLIIYFTDSTAKPSTYEHTIEKQKWTNIVFNYGSRKADLFINGSLAKSFLFDSNGPEYDAYDKVFVGSNNGLDGAICNIKYINKPQTKAQIVNNYNLLMNVNPPIQP